MRVISFLSAISTRLFSIFQRTRPAVRRLPTETTFEIFKFLRPDQTPTLLMVSRHWLNIIRRYRVELPLTVLPVTNKVGFLADKNRIIFLI